MATVDATAITRIHDVEGALTLTSIGGGAGGAANTEIFIQAAQSAGRKQSNKADHGFWLTVGSQDVSGSGVHVGVWLLHIHFAVLTLLGIRLGSTIGSATAGNWDRHNFPLADYPLTGGWVRMWIDVARTPDAQGDSGGLVKTALIGVAAISSLPAVGGNAPNLILDASDFTTTGLSLNGTAGVWQDFITADEETGANKYGVVLSKSDVIYCLARLTLGTATSLVFNDSGFVIIFPDQALVAANFMGITIDLQNAATNIDWANGVIKAPGTVKGDIVVSGTAGAFDATGMALDGLRTIDLTSACTLLDSTIVDCDKLNQNGATLTGLAILGATTADGEAFIISDNPGLVSDCSCTFSDGHAIEITAIGTYTFDGNSFTGYGADDTNDAAIYNNSGGLVTLNVVNSTNPTVRNGAGASTIVNNNITATITVKDEAGVVIQSARVSVRLDSDNSEILSGITNASGIVTGTIAANEGAVNVRVRKGSGSGTDYLPVRSPQTVGADDFNVTITMTEDLTNST